MKYLELVHNFDELNESETFSKVDEVIESLTELENSLLKQQLQTQSNLTDQKEENAELAYITNNKTQICQN